MAAAIGPFYPLPLGLTTSWFLFPPHNYEACKAAPMPPSSSAGPQCTSSRIQGPRKRSNTEFVKQDIWASVQEPNNWGRICPTKLNATLPTGADTYLSSICATLQLLPTGAHLTQSNPGCLLAEGVRIHRRRDSVL